jgi:spore coat protein A, manganese oxidase
MLNRRYFLKALTAGGVGCFLRGNGGALVAALPGGTLNLAAVPRFVTPLLIPPVMPLAGRITQPGGKNVDYYEISIRQFAQQILPTGLPQTTVWGYGPLDAERKRGVLLHNAPSLTIEAKWDTPVRVKWVNELVDTAGDYLPHLLPVDPTLHWANPPGGINGRDTRPMFSSTPGPYTGPVPMVTHLHGAVGVGDESDGYAEAWYLPAARNLPSGYANRGTWYDFFAAKAAARFGVSWGPGFAISQYPNAERACANWFHDHTLGMTRLNVYAGPAGFYMIRGGPQSDDEVRDSRSNRPATLPGPAPRENDGAEPRKTYYEIPMAIQDRSFQANGSLFYPNSRAFFDEIAGPYIPTSDISPIWNPEFFGKTIIVNGATWPFQTVEKRRYRFRVLNGCQSRFLILDFNQIPGVRVWQIGNEGGFLSSPVNIMGLAGRLLMAPAERADLIVDFSLVPAGNYVLRNAGPDEPFGGGIPGVDFEMADEATTGQILQFRVVPAVSPDPTTPPEFLRLPAAPALPSATNTRGLALLEEMSMHPGFDGPAAALLGTVSGGTLAKKLWADPVTENPNLGDTELWEFYNATEDAHPMHIHETKFEVVNRQAISLNESAGTVSLLSSPRGPEPWETGFKDTVVAYPHEVTRVRVQFRGPGQFVWHCHIVEHEDNEMMRPFRIGPAQPGEPLPKGSQHGH